MKKNVLALSITAAVVGMSFASVAQAANVGVVVGGAATGSTLALNNDGVGHMLLVPYFTAQAENATLLNLVNTDTKNGKAVKVRFRGAANSDDVLDFQVFLSPGDVWAANIAKGADGKARLITSDASCVKSSSVKAADGSLTIPFGTSRLDKTNLVGDALANGTREGYVEIFNMGDIPEFVAAKDAATLELALPTGAKNDGLNTAGVGAAGTQNPLFTAIKHVVKVAPCSGTAWTNLDTKQLTYDTGAATANSTRLNGLVPPTTGLLANWTIINVVGAAAWSGVATAIQSVDSTSKATTGNVVYFPQTSSVSGNAGNVDAVTADPLLTTLSFAKDSFGGLKQVTAAGISANLNDMPDMSTPYSAAAVASSLQTAPAAQAEQLTKAIAASAATNEYLTMSAITASTDWVFSMPTRRYSTSLQYSAIGTAVAGGANDTGMRFTNLMGNASYDTTPANRTGYFTPKNTNVTARQICVKDITYSFYDREETTLTSTVMTSPAEDATPLSFCGETSVLSINNGSTAAPTKSLKATVAQKDIDLGTGYVDGWMTLTTPGATTAGLPVLGGAFMKANNGANSFGLFFAHRFAR